MVSATASAASPRNKSKQAADNRIDSAMASDFTLQGASSTPATPSSSSGNMPNGLEDKEGTQMVEKDIKDLPSPAKDDPSKKDSPPTKYPTARARPQSGGSSDAKSRTRSNSGGSSTTCTCSATFSGSSNTLVATTNGSSTSFTAHHHVFDHRRKRRPKSKASSLKNTAAPTPPTMSAAFAKSPIREKYLAILGHILRFSGLGMVTWEVALATIRIALINGGPASLIYGFLISFIGSICIAASLAELTSIWPVSGSQFLWVHELAPESYRRFLSYFVGHLAFWGSQATVAGLLYVMTEVICGISWFWGSSFFSEAWHHVVIFSWPLALGIGFGLSKYEPYLAWAEIFAHGCHVFTMILIPVTLGMVGQMRVPRVANNFIWETIFADESYWSSTPAIAVNVGLIGVFFAFSRVDTPIVKAEFVQYSATAVPNALMFNVSAEGLMALVGVIVMAYFMAEWNDVINHPSHMPYMVSLYHWTTSKALVLFLTMPILIHLSEAIAIAMLKSSVIIRSLAQSDGFYGGGRHFKAFGVANKQGLFPYNYYVTIIIACAMISLRFINVEAYQPIFSVAIMGTQLSYVVPIALLMVARARGTAEMGLWKMNKYLAPVVNLVAIIYAIYSAVFSAFPTGPILTVKNFPYGPAILVTVMTIAVLNWGFSARDYFGPKEKLKNIGQEWLIGKLMAFDPARLEPGVVTRDGRKWPSSGKGSGSQSGAKNV